MKDAQNAIILVLSIIPNSYDPLMKAKRYFMSAKIAGIVIIYYSIINTTTTTIVKVYIWLITNWLVIKL